jgi:hypothetical protein
VKLKNGGIQKEAGSKSNLWDTILLTYLKQFLFNFTNSTGFSSARGGAHVWGAWGRPDCNRNHPQTF